MIAGTGGAGGTSITAATRTAGHGGGASGGDGGTGGFTLSGATVTANPGNDGIPGYVVEMILRICSVDRASCGWYCVARSDGRPDLYQQQIRYGRRRFRGVQAPDSASAEPKILVDQPN